MDINVLKWIAFIFACAAGIFLTSDSLSEEKREGTLGLLFLTDLRGHDVVLGKLLATSLRTFYSLLAIFPVMAFSFVLGGVAAEDFRHTLLALCNALFFSLALGMAVSVISRDSNKAMTAAAGAMVVFLILIPGLDSLLPGGNAGAAVVWFAVSRLCLHPYDFLSRVGILVEPNPRATGGLVFPGHRQLAGAQNVAGQGQSATFPERDGNFAFLAPPPPAPAARNCWIKTRFAG